jgi:hypothetical protein
MALSLKKLNIQSGSGIVLSPDGVSNWRGNVNDVVEISIGQDVSIQSNVIFNVVSASYMKIGTNSLNIEEGGVTGSFYVTGSMSTTQNLSVGGDAIILGTIVANKIETELSSSSTIYTSGSTEFGNTVDDVIDFTGSFNLSGSLDNITRVSSDSQLSGSSSNSLVVESAIKSYIDSIEFSSNFNFLRKRFVKQATSVISNSTASFSAVTASDAVSSLNVVDKNDFIFFINAQVMESDALDIEQYNANTCYLKVNTSSLGYTLNATDDIVAWGKWNS